MRSKSRRDEFAGETVCPHMKKRQLTHKEKESPEEVSQEAGDEVVDSSEWHQIAFCKNPLSFENEPIPVQSDTLDRGRLFTAEARHITQSSL